MASLTGQMTSLVKWHHSGQMTLILVKWHNFSFTLDRVSGTITVVSQCVYMQTIMCLLFVCADHHVPVVVCVCRPSGACCCCLCVQTINCLLFVCTDHQVPVVCVCRPSGACCCLCVQTIRCLLSLGADVNARDKNERTALQLAVAVNRPMVARCLIDAGGQFPVISCVDRPRVVRC